MSLRFFSPRKFRKFEQKNWFQFHYTEHQKMNFQQKNLKILRFFNDGNLV